MVVLEGKYSVNDEVSQGSTLGPSLFLLYIDDLSIMLSVILLPMLTILHSALSVTERLIGRKK